MNCWNDFMFKFFYIFLVNLFQYLIIQCKQLFKKYDRIKNKFSIMIIAPHQDDEVVGAGGKIIRIIKNNESVFVVYVTNSISKQYIQSLPFHRLVKYIATLNRRIESKIAMNLVGVPLKNLYFLNNDARILDGYRSYPNPELTEHILEIKENIQNLIIRLRPNEIYVSAYEGGHCDHDLINFIVSKITEELNLSRVYEMPFYPTNYPDYLKGPEFSIYQEFILSSKGQDTSSSEIISLDLNKDEKRLKLKMLKAFRSQNPFLIKNMNKSDKFRLLPKYDYMNPPHDGAVYSQGNLICGIIFNDFKNAVSEDD